MKRKFSIVFLIMILGLIAGCGNHESNQETGSDTTDISDLTNEFKDSYNKYIVKSNYACDIDELTNYFIDDLEQYTDKIEYSEWDGVKDYVLKLSMNTYYWTERPDDKGCSLNVHSLMSKEEYQYTQEKVKIFLENLDIDIECFSVKDMENAIEYRYRQVLDGVMISNAPASEVTTIMVDIGRYEGYAIFLWGLVEEVEIIETYNTTEFMDVDSIKRMVEYYRERMNSAYGRSNTNVEITINEINVVYYPIVKNDEKVLIPAYELTVTENDDGRILDAIYTVDALTGYVYYRIGDRYW